MQSPYPQLFPLSNSHTPSNCSLCPKSPQGQVPGNYSAESARIIQTVPSYMTQGTYVAWPIPSWESPG